MKKKTKILISILCIISLIFTISFIYVNDYYHAKDVSIYLKSNNQIIVKQKSNGLLFKNKKSKDLFIFYPGAKVEYSAYSELMYKLSSNKIDCYLVKMPANLAFLGMNKADSIIENTNYKNYYIGGHSLGGAMAANYAYSNQKKIKGLVLLGSYSTKNLSNSNIQILTIYGSNDLVLNRKNYNKNKKNLGSNYEEVIIKGGNHSSFASYGKQKGDGVSILKKHEQINIADEKIENFIHNK